MEDHVCREHNGARDFPQHWSGAEQESKGHHQNEGKASGTSSLEAQNGFAGFCLWEKLP